MGRVNWRSSRYLGDCKIVYKNLHCFDDGRLIMWRINRRVHMTVIAYVEKDVRLEY